MIDGNDASETCNVTLELVWRGYTEEQIEKLRGGNLLRVMDEVHSVAGEMQKEFDWSRRVRLRTAELR